MEQINTLLNLPEHATASDRACAVYELMQEYDNIQAARDTAEHECMSLREATSHIFAESICAARGITDADAQEDIRAAWCQDPYAALNALAGESITAANPYGCNQYGHEWRGKHGEGWKGVDRQHDKKKREEEEKKKNTDSQKGKNLSDALKKLAPRTDKNGQGLMPFATETQDSEVDDFENASTDKKREILAEWKNKVRNARARKDGTEAEEKEQ